MFINLEEINNAKVVISIKY